MNYYDKKFDINKVGYSYALDFSITKYAKLLLRVEKFSNKYFAVNADQFQYTDFGINEFVFSGVLTILW